MNQPTGEKMVCKLYNKQFMRRVTTKKRRLALGSWLVGWLVVNGESAGDV